MMSLATFGAPALAKISPYLDVVKADKEKGISHEKVIKKWSSSSPIPLERLKVVTFSYVDFKDKAHHDGQIVVMDAVAPRVQKIFNTLFARKFPIAKAKRMEFYNGDDKAALEDNNTASYNSRTNIGDTSVPSIHAYGLAIDINPVQNPFVFSEKGDKEAGIRRVDPKRSAVLYINRVRAQNDKLPGLAEYVKDVFEANGFTTWGGNWNDPIDWQHFQTSRGLARLLAVMQPKDAEAFFEMHANQPRLMTEISSNETTFINAYQRNPEKFMRVFRENSKLLSLSSKVAIQKFKEIWNS